MLLCALSHDAGAAMLVVLLLFALVQTNWLAHAEPSPYPEVDVFTIGEGGYFCIKIPYLFATRNGTLLAFGEGRRGSCSDITATDLVFKTSHDNGATWSGLRVLYSKPNTTVGNAAPLQLRGTGRILVPFCENNFLVWQTHSDDDGVTWSPPELIPGGTRSGWQWVGTGPPGGMQLVSGRLVVPSYHSYVANTDGDIDRAHMMLNDDPTGRAAGWYIGGVAPGIELTSESQAVELSPDHLLITTHGLLTQRIQIESFDGGLTLEEPYFIAITSPLGGCEGSILKYTTANSSGASTDQKTSLLIFSGTVNLDPERYNMTVWTSTDEGKSWTYGFSVNPGKTAYSSLAMMPDKRSVGLLYERSNASNFIFLPTHFSFLVVYPFPSL